MIIGDLRRHIEMYDTMCDTVESIIYEVVLKEAPDSCTTVKNVAVGEASEQIVRYITEHLDEVG